MSRRLKITIPDCEAFCMAELEEELAPKTCEAIWKALPHRGPANHAMWAGHEVMTKLAVTEELKRVPRENITMYPRAGDCLYSYFPPAWEGGLRGLREPVCDFAIWYGPDSPLYQIDGPHPMNHFAVIVEGLNSFAEAAQKILYEGIKEIVIERY